MRNSASGVSLRVWVTTITERQTAYVKTKPWFLGEAWISVKVTTRYTQKSFQWEQSTDRFILSHIFSCHLAMQWEDAGTRNPTAKLGVKVSRSVMTFHFSGWEHPLEIKTTMSTLFTRMGTSVQNGKGHKTLIHACLSFWENMRKETGIWLPLGRIRKNQTHVWEQCSIEKCRWKLLWTTVGTWRGQHRCDSQWQYCILLVQQCVCMCVHVLKLCPSTLVRPLVAYAYHCASLG